MQCSSMLFHGPPGCGKTLIARQLSKKIGDCSFQAISGPELMNKYWILFEMNCLTLKPFSLAKYANNIFLVFILQIRWGSGRKTARSIWICRKVVDDEKSALVYFFWRNRLRNWPSKQSGQLVWNSLCGLVFIGYGWI